MKEVIVSKINNLFDQWSSDIPFACKKGCTACCTQNVSVSGVEARIILDKIAQEGRQQWFVEKLMNTGDITGPSLTTNEFAKACMEGKDVDPGGNNNLSPCPFLEEGQCAIYETRPFGCRCFSSTETCSPQTAAITPEYYLTASTVIYQLIEHLDQGEYWGNMFDLLRVYCSLHGSPIKHDELNLESNLIKKAQGKLLRATPLPGLLFTEEDQKHIGPLLDSIFTAQVNNKTIEDALNGK